MKNWKKWGLIIGLLGIVLGIFASIQMKKSSEKITQFRLVIDDYFKNEQFFVDENVLKNRLEQAGMREIQGKNVGEVNLLELESALEQMEYVADAKAYFTMQKELVVEVTQRVPVLRVFNRSGQSFYLDQKGKIMATSPHFSAYCLVASGDIGTLYRKNASDSGLVFQLAQMAYELGKKESTSGLFTQISIENDAVWLISRIEGFPCRVDLQQPIIPQVNKWLAFVSGADSTGGWTKKYEAVDLRFSNQVVALQRGRKIKFGELPPIKSDTIQNVADSASRILPKKEEKRKEKPIEPKKKSTEKEKKTSTRKIEEKKKEKSKKNDTNKKKNKNQKK